MAQRLRLATGNIYLSARSRARDTANALVLDIGHVWQPAYLRGFCADHAARRAVAGGTFGAGVGANVPVAGSVRATAPCRRSVQAQTGVSIATGACTMELATAPARR
jgi:hypothetical protein